MTSYKNELYPVLTYQEFYGKLPHNNDPLKELNAFDLNDAILALIMIGNEMHQISNPQIKIQQTLLNRLPKAKAFRLSVLIKDKLDNPFLLTTQTVIAKIITDIYKLISTNKPSKNAEDSEFEDILLDVILTYNQNQYQEIETGPLINKHEHLWKIMLMQDLTGLTNIDYVRTSNIKHLIFIQFLKDILGDNFEKVNIAFRDRTGGSNIYLFIISVMTMYLSIEKKFKEPNSSLIWFEKNTPQYEVLKKFDLIFDADISKTTTFDLSFYVTHPFFEHPNGKIWLVDHGQFAFALEKGWLYYFFKNSAITSYIPLIKNYSNFLSYLGKNYYEQYLIFGLLNSLNRTGFRVLKTDDKDMPDAAAILNENDVFLFEIKSSSLHYKVIEDKSSDALKKFIDENFAGKKKGAAQLSRTIKSLASNTTAYKFKNQINKLTIYPVIIYTERHLEKHGIGDYINEKFSEMMQNFEAPFKEIKPLIMIHYDFFVENISLLDKRPSLLKSAINQSISNSN